MTNTLPNLLHVCVHDHEFIEWRRAVAIQRGWLVKQAMDPATVPVLHSRHERPVFLLDDGTIREATDAELITAALSLPYDYPSTTTQDGR